MSKSLVIVESPTKVKTLKGFLGPDFKIMGSQGHVRDLPSKGLAVDVKNDFEPTYDLLPDRKKIVDELKKAAAGVDVVYLASDPDREGEAIAWHIREALKLKNVRRIEFNEITKTAVQRALQNPRDIDMDRVNAQQARRVLDRLIGYELSPLLARKVQRGASAGRVQSVALRLVVEREREIQAFKIEEYWSITANLTPQSEKFPFNAILRTRGGKKVEIANESEATTLVEALQNQNYVVQNVKKSEKRRNPGAPFITSTLQQEASKQLRYGAQRTMRIAQDLYEGIEIGQGAPTGLITYMRTDSTSIAKEAQAAAREFISQRYGPQFVPDNPPVYKNRKSAQEAHEAVRPTDVSIVPEEIQSFLSPDQFKLYRLIWRRFVASQMKSAILDVTTVDVQAGEFGLRASGSIVKFQGFLSVYEDARDEDAKEAEADDENSDRRLPALENNQPLDLLKIDPKQHFTQPPPRYTEATLVKALEENGIGRPSTYAQILSTIVDRNYAESEQRRFKPTELGFLVNDKLVSHFGDIVDVHFTAGVEEKLDEVEEGKRGWTQVLHDFYDPFHAGVERAKVEMEKVGPEETDITCPTCNTQKLLKRRGRFGEFYACPNEECKATFNIGDEGQPLAKSEKKVVEVEGIEPGAKRECEKCGKDMVVRTSNRGAFWGCTGYPKCRNLVPIEGAVVKGAEGEENTDGAAPAKPAKPEPEMTSYACPKCKSPMLKRVGRFGPFLGCSDYPKCKTIVNLDKEGKPKQELATVEA